MFLKACLGAAIVAGIFVLSPVRRGDDPAQLVAHVGESAASVATRTIAETLTHAPAPPLRPSLQDLLAAALKDDGTDAAGAEPSARHEIPVEPAQPAARPTERRPPPLPPARI